MKQFTRSGECHYIKNRKTENKVIGTLEEKQPHEVFKLYLNEELKLKLKNIGKV